MAWDELDLELELGEQIERECTGFRSGRNLLWALHSLGRWGIRARIGSVENEDDNENENRDGL